MIDTSGRVILVGGVVAIAVAVVGAMVIVAIAIVVAVAVIVVAVIVVVVVGGEEVCGVAGEVHREIGDAVHEASQLRQGFPGEGVPRDVRC